MLTALHHPCCCSPPPPPRPPSPTDPHKTRVRAFLETSYEGLIRMLEDPWLFIWHLHLLLTAIHFLTWVSSYGFVGGSGPASITVSVCVGGGPGALLGADRVADWFLWVSLGKGAAIAWSWSSSSIGFYGSMGWALQHCCMLCCNINTYVLWQMP